MEKRNPFKSTEQQPEQQPSKLVGGNLPLPLVNRLRLLAVYYGNSMQWILHQAAIKWNESIPETNEQITQSLIEKAFAEWSRRMEGKRISKREREKYLQEVKSILERRKVVEEHIEIILQGLKERMVG